MTPDLITIALAVAFALYAVRVSGLLCFLTGIHRIPPGNKSCSRCGAVL